MDCGRELHYLDNPTSSDEGWRHANCDIEVDYAAAFDLAWHLAFHARGGLGHRAPDALNQAISHRTYRWFVTMP